MSHKHIVHISDVPSEPLPAPDGTSFGGLRQRVGVAVGAQKLGYGLFTVSPGKAAFPLHAHTLNEELIYILDGEGTLRFGAETVAVRAGMFIACPGGPELTHQLVNTSDADLRYLCVSTMQYPDIVHYPGLRQGGRLRRPRRVRSKAVSRHLQEGDRGAVLPGRDRPRGEGTAVSAFRVAFLDAATFGVFPWTGSRKPVSAPCTN